MCITIVRVVISQLLGLITMVAPWIRNNPTKHDVPLLKKARKHLHKNTCDVSSCFKPHEKITKRTDTLQPGGPNICENQPNTCGAVGRLPQRPEGWDIMQPLQLSGLVSSYKMLKLELHRQDPDLGKSPLPSRRISVRLKASFWPRFILFVFFLN